MGNKCMGGVAADKADMDALKQQKVTGKDRSGKAKKGDKEKGPGQDKQIMGSTVG